MRHKSSGFLSSILSLLCLTNLFFANCQKIVEWPTKIEFYDPNNINGDPTDSIDLISVTWYQQDDIF